MHFVDRDRIQRSFASLKDDNPDLDDGWMLLAFCGKSGFSLEFKLYVSIDQVDYVSKLSIKDQP